VPRNNRDLIKKYRIDEVADKTSGETAGIYVDPHNGEFYGRVPETPEGEKYRDKDKRKLEAVLQEALKAFYSVTWKQVIRVQYNSPMRAQAHGRSASANGFQWSPDGDPSEGSDILGPLYIHTIETAVRPDGSCVYRPWRPDYALLPDAMRRGDQAKVSIDVQRNPGSRWRDANTVDLPYTPETHEAVIDFQRRLRETDHKIRTFLFTGGAEDVQQRLMAADRSLPLLGGGQGDVTPPEAPRG
jgi:hypothetical protein